MKGEKKTVRKQPSIREENQDLENLISSGKSDEAKVVLSTKNLETLAKMFVVAHKDKKSDLAAFILHNMPDSLKQPTAFVIMTAQVALESKEYGLAAHILRSWSESKKSEINALLDELEQDGEEVSIEELREILLENERSDLADFLGIDGEDEDGTFENSLQVFGELVVQNYQESGYDAIVDVLEMIPEHLQNETTVITIVQVALDKQEYELAEKFLKAWTKIKE